MSLGEFDVLSPGPSRALSKGFVYLPNNTPRHAQNQRTRWNLHALEQERSRPDHTSRTNSDSRQDDRTHSDQALSIDSAAMQDGPMSNRNARTDDAWSAFVDMDNRKVLHVARLTDHDLSEVGTEDRAVPYAR
jgi:hypothetical protein